MNTQRLPIDASGCSNQPGGSSVEMHPGCETSSQACTQHAALNDETLVRFAKAFNEAVFDTDGEKAMQIVHTAVERGVSPEDIVLKIVIPSVDSMLALVGENRVNLAQHFMTAQIASDVTEEMLSRFSRKPEIVGKVVLGTSQNDFHGLGKKIVGGCLRARLIDVVDLGLSVAPERFVDEAVAHDAQVIGISSLMVHTARGENGCLGVRHILEERNLEDRIKIVVGGAPFRWDNGLWKVVRADAWADNAIEACPVITSLIQRVRS